MNFRARGHGATAHCFLARIECPKNAQLSRGRPTPPKLFNGHFDGKHSHWTEIYGVVPGPASVGGRAGVVTAGSLLAVLGPTLMWEFTNVTMRVETTTASTAIQ